MNNYCLIISYEGTGFFGWQESPTHPTIEGELRSVLEQLTSHSIVLQAASRTDRGVHAHGQVVNFFSPKSVKIHAINALLPPSIRVIHLEKKDKDFHPTLDAKGKEYLYKIDRDPIQSPFTRHLAWHIWGKFDLNLARKAASYMVGTHDFSAFCNTTLGKDYDNKVRELWRFDLVEKENQIICYLSGNHFLYKMARNLVGNVVEVGRGLQTVEKVMTLLKDKKRKDAGICAPAHGLALNRVFYHNSSHDWKK